MKRVGKVGSFVVEVIEEDDPPRGGDPTMKPGNIALDGHWSKSEKE